MFDFFKMKKNKSDVLVEMALGLLEIQITLGSSEDNKKLNKITLDRFSRGYIFGLCDSVLQSSGKKDCKDYNELMRFLKSIHIKLFGEKEGVNVLNTSCNEVQNQIFMKGRMKGGQEFVEFIRDNKAPMGLATYLQKNIK